MARTLLGNLNPRDGGVYWRGFADSFSVSAALNHLRADGRVPIRCLQSVTAAAAK